MLFVSPLQGRSASPTKKMEKENGLILDERYHMSIVVIETKADGSPGDVFADFAKFKATHPHSSYRFGFCIIDNRTGYIPDECNDWNDSLEEALMDFFENCCQ